MRRYLWLSTGLVVAALAGFARAGHRPAWTDSEREVLSELRFDPNAPARPDPTNKVADDPRAAALGHRLFFDTRLSANGQVACATCHDPARDFQDGTPLATGVGTTGRRTMPVAGTDQGAWLFWDGRKDSQWSQALGPWESAVEHGGTRSQYARLIATHYRADYEKIFGPLPDLSDLPERAAPIADAKAAAAWAALPAARREAVNRIYANLGKAVAAYERRIRYGESRFDRYVAAMERTGRAPAGILTEEEEAGLRIFIGKGRCATCHTGPMLSDQEFHNIGVPARAGHAPDSGRVAGVRQVLADEFNCRSPYSDSRESCEELEFAVTEGEALVGAMKTPSLRNVARRAPYMHAGQFATLEEVVDHYDKAPAAPLGKSELVPLNLTAKERRQLIAFLGSLTAPLATPDSLLRAPASR
jgi:cytochrome c peroxidase